MLKVNRLSRNTITLLASNGGSAALSFVLSVLIGRALGQDGLGVYATVLAWIFPLSLLADFGLGTLMTREVAQNPDSDILRDTTLTRLLLSGGFMLALVLAAPFLSDDASVVQGIQISAPLVLIAPFFGAFTAIFRAYRIMWPIVWLNLGMLLAQVIFTALVFLGGGDVIAALVVNVVTSAAQLAAAWAVWRWKFQQMSEAGLATTIGMSMGNILRRAWPFALAGILAAVQLRFSVILLERLARAGEVGYYAAAIRFIEAGRMIPNALFGALFPILAALAAQPQMMSATFRRVMLGLTIFGAALGVIVTLLAPVIITLTYGEEFLPAAPVLQIAMWTLLPRAQLLPG
jgi:O-antigen/teichoic acid export membrane protein